MLKRKNIPSTTPHIIQIIRKRKYEFTKSQDYVVLSFMGLLRFSEIINLKCLDIILKETPMSIFIEKSKTDVLREDYWMHFSKLQSTFIQ